MAEEAEPGPAPQAEGSAEKRETQTPSHGTDMLRLHVSRISMSRRISTMLQQGEGARVPRAREAPLGQAFSLRKEAADMMPHPLKPLQGRLADAARLDVGAIQSITKSSGGALRMLWTYQAMLEVKAGTGFNDTGYVKELLPVIAVVITDDKSRDTLLQSGVLRPVLRGLAHESVELQNVRQPSGGGHAKRLRSQPRRARAAAPPDAPPPPVPPPLPRGRRSPPSRL